MEENANKLVLTETPEGLVLSGKDMELKADFAKSLDRLKKGNLQRELLVKAAKIKGIDNATVIDATAGLGEDSLLLAAAGFKVHLFEKDPIIGALLKDAVERAVKISEISHAIANMTIHLQDSIDAMNTGKIQADIILLDPMFPVRKKSGLVKKKFQLLQELERPCDNEEELLNSALNSGALKIVIKRPAKGPYLAGRKPDYSVSGKTVRYDCIILHKQ